MWVNLTGRDAPHMVTMRSIWLLLVTGMIPAEIGTFTPAISIIDGGTMGMELLTYMRGMKKILLVDAINGGDAPGTIYEFPHKELEQYFTEHISVHEVGMQDILRIRAIQEDPLEDAVVIGVEPESLEIGFEPSEPVQCALPEVKKRVLNVLREWGVVAEPKA